MNNMTLHLVPKVNCPLMPEAYRDELRACNIPITRAKLLETESTCCDCDTSECFPWKIFPVEAKEEADPPVQNSSRKLIYRNA